MNQLLFNPFHQSPAGTAPSRKWEVYLFGGLRVRAADDHGWLRLQGKQRELLTLLAFDRLCNRTAVTRYCDALWPESDGAAARSNLDSAIHRLRKTFDCAPAVRVCDGSVWLDEEVCMTDLDMLCRLDAELDAREQISGEELQSMATELLKLSEAGGLVDDERQSRSPVGKGLNVALYLWRTVTRELALRLQAAGMTRRATRLCERCIGKGGNDAALLQLWIRLLECSGQPIAAIYVHEEFSRVASLDAR